MFFDHVYPILPVVDPVDFYRRYDAGGAASVSPLLLQTMFLAASNVSGPSPSFPPPLSDHGHSSSPSPG